MTSAIAISLPNNIKINWKVVFFVGLVAMVISLVFYAWQVNDLTKGSYLINSYQNKITQLTNENQNLQVSFAESSFLGQALARAQELNFQKTIFVKYVQVLNNSFTAVNIK